MLDIKLIRENPQLVLDKLSKRSGDFSGYIKEILEIDEKRRELIVSSDKMKNEQNIKSKLIPQYKKEGKDTGELLEEMKLLSEKVKDEFSQISLLEEKQKDLLLSIPNIPHNSVPEGKTEDNNLEVYKYGTPREFNFEAKPHWELGKNLGILDPETAAKVTGTRFHFYYGLGARLERAVINFFLNTHTQNGYIEVQPPYMVNRASMTGTGQLPKFEDDAFKINNTDYFLIPTAEVPVTNMYRDDILDGNTLTKSYCAYSACFRAEAGSAGRDVRGLIRQHQFNKVELVKFTSPDNSYEELEKLTNDAKKVLELLELPYRVVALCGGDLGFSAAKTYDIEVYLPSYNTYKEISSCSNFEDYQARRANIRFKMSAKDKTQFVHTLNGSGLAIGRTVAAILENYQNEDGSVTVPKVLIPYMGCEIIN